MTLVTNVVFSTTFLAAAQMENAATPFPVVPESRSAVETLAVLEAPNALLSTISQPVPSLMVVQQLLLHQRLQLLRTVRPPTRTQAAQLVDTSNA